MKCWKYWLAMWIIAVVLDIGVGTGTGVWFMLGTIVMYLDRMEAKR